MTSSLLYNNLAIYSLQIGLLVALAAVVPALVRLRAPRARLLYWQFLLAACLLLPLMRPWRQEVIAGDVGVSTVVTSIAPATEHHRSIPWNAAPLVVLAAGVLGRLAWLGLGFYRLRRYRLHATPLGQGGICPALLSAEISSPVTFGFFRPVILLPARFPTLPAPMQEAILRHEGLHVERRDWLFTLAEELVRAVFWFHPGIWWLLSEIQLAREQVVDQCVVAATNARDPYVDTLLAVASEGKYLDLAPAPLFLRRRHLKQRVMGILKERNMSKKALISALAAGLVLMAAACWFVTGALPLAAAPQLVADSAGVSVNLNGAPLMHRAPVAYPPGAMANHVEGSVMVQVKLDGNGEVSDAIVLSGPEELRKPVIQSVLNWHFSKDAAGTTRTVSVDFVLPQQSAQPVDGGPTTTAAATAEGDKRLAQEAARLTELQGRLTSQPPAANRTPVAAPPWPGTNSVSRTITSIRFQGLSDEAAEQLRGKLGVHVGDDLDAEYLAGLRATIREFDSHLNLVASPAGGGEVGLLILLPSVATALGAPATGFAYTATPLVGAPQRIRVGGNVQASNLIIQQRPVYPPDAKAARISGTVELSAVIGRDGHMVDLQVVQGHPLLVQAALDAVKNWVYKPTLLNGDPVEVSTIIDVNFTLAQ